MLVDTHINEALEHPPFSNCTQNKSVFLQGREVRRKCLFRNLSNEKSYINAPGSLYVSRSSCSFKVKYTYSKRIIFKEEARANENFLEGTLDNVGVLISVSEEILLREYGFVTVSFSNCEAVKIIHF
jgi:hypothetical protein